eukprot:4741422-Amphidinium_carterae.1
MASTTASGNAEAKTRLPKPPCTAPSQMQPHRARPSQTPDPAMIGLTQTDSRTGFHQLNGDCAIAHFLISLGDIGNFRGDHTCRGVQGVRMRAARFQYCVDYRKAA